MQTRDDPESLNDRETQPDPCRWACPPPLRVVVHDVGGESRSPRRRRPSSRCHSTANLSLGSAGTHTILRDSRSPPYGANEVLDIIITGAGLSALLLAQSLLAVRDDIQLQLVGPSSTGRSHVLSYWSSEQTPFDLDVIASWSTVSIVDRHGHELRAPLKRNRYHTLRVEAWIDRMTQALGPRVEQITGTVEAIAPDDRSVRLRVGEHELKADWVFASHRVSSPPDCWQRFLGWEVTVPEPVCDLDVARIMDFRTAAEGDFRFVYLLPLTETRILVEHVSYEPCDHAAHLEAYLRDVLALSTWEVVRQESGATPIFRDPPPRTQNRVIPIGVGGGLAKPATGYAITRMWRDAEQIAASLRDHDEPIAAPARGMLYRLSDHYFVDLLGTDPSQICDLLTALFRHVPGDALLDFLDEQASLGDRLAVARWVPGWLKWLQSRSAS
ncbi:MAG: hypothetical protein B7733_07185 [Myxococcales bacterium FL481]|nr:MAG: hypothetical protein B7733_07185 [Myxococcales bacterium FL481]